LRSAPRFYKPELDVLRFFAFLLVFIHHVIPNRASDYVAKLGPTLAEWAASAGRAGAIGVDLFFALSSYLITELLLREAEFSGTVDVKAFYIRRILRIWPLYFFFLALSATLVPRLLPGDRLSGEYLVMFLLLLGNWMCAFRGYPSSSAAPLWSVSMEEQFYLAWPLILGFTGARKLARLCVAMLIVAMVYRLGLVRLGLDHPATWCMTFSRLDPIAAGALLAILLRRRQIKVGFAARAGLIIAGFVCWLLVARYLRIDAPPSLAMALIGYPAIAVGAILILFAFTNPSSSRGTSMLRLPALIYLGRISYGLYVYHLLSLALVSRFAGQFIQRHFLLIQFFGGLALTIGLSALSFQLLEQPFLRLKARFTHVPSR
jgi:peptidoglycan/LPS O-acetylase OafA/YrhL